ncbi:MAG: hypothetical protein AMS27_06790 [Bacteroides sp. SM23_62_1]|nr:MAG: hypothetical protein AMS27_06790 [Bacteroides sp. SM23_62_1]
MKIKEFELTTIQENAFIYETHLRNVNRRRELWKSETKEKIKHTLEAVKKNFPKINWSVHVLDSKTNFETITLKISDSPSGISDSSPVKGKVRQYVKKGAAMGFSQMISGKIRVWFKFPFVEDIQETEEPVKNLVIIEPTYVAENLIAGYVQQFLSDITAYESNI